MANMSEILNSSAENYFDLQELLLNAKRWGFVTASQYTTILQEIAPMLPCRVLLNMRTKKGTAYVTVVGNDKLRTFMVNNRARIL